MGGGEGRYGVSVGGTKEWRTEGSWYRRTGWGIGGQVGKGEGSEGGSKCRRHIGIEEGGKLVVGSRVGNRGRSG